MTIEPNGAHRTQTRRLLRKIRLIAFITLLVSPLAQAAWVVHVLPDATDERRSTAPGPEKTRVAARRAEYLAERDPIVDKLLPDGSGGTRFSEHLAGDAAGIAFVDRAAIGLSATADLGEFPEAVELHERAHLVQAFRPALVAALMARVPPAAAGEYAATDPGEHFAEMAAMAWTMVAPAKTFCIDRAPASLVALERRVPGTAGFVRYFLRQGHFDEVDLGPTADQLSAPYRAEMDAIVAAIDARRRQDDSFSPWRYDTVRSYLESRRDRVRTSDEWFDRVYLVLLQPSLNVARLMD